jgi:hypothetical protein
MPEVTRPQTVYWLLRNWASAKTMKNWLSALFGLCRDVLARAAAPGAGRIAGLGHEAVDHAVEDDAVVEALSGQLADSRHVPGRQLGQQLDLDRAVGQLHHQHVLGVGRVLALGGLGHGKARS